MAVSVGGRPVFSSSASSITTFAALAVPIWPAICDTEAGTYHFVFHATGYRRDGQPVVREAMRDKVVQQKTTTGGGGDGGGVKDCHENLLRAINHQTELLEEVLKRR